MRTIDKLLNLIFVPKCICCDEPLPYNCEEVFCDECRAEWENAKNERCRTCNQSINDCYCGIRDNKDAIVDKEIHLVQYDKSVRNAANKLIYSCKDKNVGAYFRAIALEMYKELYPRLEKKDYIVCSVPRTVEAVRRKGHDQSREIALEFCALSGLRYSDLLYNKGTNAQKSHRTLKNRTENASKSYMINSDVNKTLKGRYVILIDDIVTTGASTVRCAKLLKSKGAKKVYVMTIAKTVR